MHAQQPNTAKSCSKARFYAVARGHEPGLYPYDEDTGDLRARKAWEGFSNPVVKSFRTRQEALDFLVEKGVQMGEGIDKGLADPSETVKCDI